MLNRSDTRRGSSRRTRASRRAACAALLVAVPVISLGGTPLAHADTSPPARASAAGPAQDGRDAVPAAQTPVTDGGFPLEIRGNPQYYVAIVGQQTPGHYSFAEPDGSVLPVTQQLKDGMSFQLSAVTGGDGVAKIPLPPRLEGGRIFISRKPLVMPPATDGAGHPSDTGYVQPDLNNPSDPNQGNPYDFFEFTFANGKIAFGGNTTQVDGFSIPMTAELKQESSGFDKSVGIKDKTAEQVITDYRTHVDGTPFASLVNADGTHITAPRSAPVFQPGGEGAHYFDPAIKDAWNRWEGEGKFRLSDGENVYVGGTQGNGTLLTFKKEVSGKPTGDEGSVSMPTTADVSACAGSLAQGSDMEKFVEARLCAAFNRGITQNSPETWDNADTYYKDGSFNKYAAFFHEVSENNLAYAFPYDDVNNRSSVMILPNADAPSSLTLTVGN